MIADGGVSRIVWIDAQLPPSLATWLTQEHQVNAIHVAKVDLLGADDAVIFDAARSGRASVVLTKDADFVRLLERHGPPPQIVWVTAGNVRNAVLRDLVSSAWPRVRELLQSGEPLIEIGRRT